MQLHQRRQPGRRVGDLKRLCDKLAAKRRQAKQIAIQPLVAQIPPASHQRRSSQHQRYVDETELVNG